MPRFALLGKSRLSKVLTATLAVSSLAALVWFCRPSRESSCGGSPEVLEMKDVYMAGRIEKGAQFRMLPGWYSCHPVERGDLVYYSYSDQDEPVVKIARGLPGDRFETVRDPKRPAWNLKVNEEVIDWDRGGPYFFGTDEPPTLSLYESERNNVLREGELILLSNVPPGDADSARIGLARVQDLVGKVEPLSQ